MTTAQSKSVVTLALGALVVAFAISFGVGKLTKKSTTAAAPAKTQIVSLSSQKPAVPHFESGGSIPGLKVAPKRKAPSVSGSSSNPAQPVTPSPRPQPKTNPQPQPKANPKPQPKPHSSVQEDPS
jgi:pyruvate dehydrogenase E2 component (dihydrolipoamide acetyltransferase)